MAIVSNQDYSKGSVLGGIAALPFSLIALVDRSDSPWWLRIGWALAAYMLSLPPVTAYPALNFTGSTTFTSKTGVRREIMRYIPLMAWSFGIGLALILALVLIRLFL